MLNEINQTERQVSHNLIYMESKTPKQIKIDSEKQMSACQRGEAEAVGETVKGLKGTNPQL